MIDGRSCGRCRQGVGDDALSALSDNALPFQHGVLRRHCVLPDLLFPEDSACASSAISRAAQ
jgi:hypothetical protein